MTGPHNLQTEFLLERLARLNRGLDDLNAELDKGLEKDREHLRATAAEAAAGERDPARQRELERLARGETTAQEFMQTEAGGAFLADRRDEGRELLERAIAAEGAQEHPDDDGLGK